jgi:hypothetical protein
VLSVLSKLSVLSVLSCLIDLHMHCVDDSALESKAATTMLGQARKLTLGASRGSVTPSSYT